MIPSRLLRISAAALALAIAAGSLATALPAWADPPGHAKKEKGLGPQGSKGKGGGDSISINVSFSDSDRVAIRNYYGGPMPGGRCPPGLAKKNNGCMPPGQAKKWMMGHPLPRDVVFYDLPHELRIRMSVPPAGYKYVRVAGDILMIVAGTGMVAAAIQDLAMM
jgi:Ni/Co efflux regulator RcnB